MKLGCQKREQLSSATIVQSFWLILLCSVILGVTAFASPPAWWSSRGAVSAPVVTTNNGVVTTNYVPNNYAVATQGQLKQFTARAVDELNANLPGGAGTNLNTMVSNWASDYATNGYSSTHIKPSDYTAMNVGQLKYIGNKIWSRLVAGGYTNSVPSWLQQNTNTDGSLANIGQLKSVFNFTLPQVAAAAPTFWPAGGTYTAPQQVVISSTAGATIYYTTNNTAPTTSSPSFTSGTPLGVGANITIQAKALAPGYSMSAAGVASYTILNTVAAPTYSVAAGAYGTAQTVVLGCSSSNATIYYTTDGTTPSTSSLSAQSGTSIIVAANETLQAFAAVSGMSSSLTVANAYQIAAATAPAGSGLSLWLNASVGITNDANGNIASWKDQSGLHNDAAPVSPSPVTTGQGALIQPNSINGQPVAHFTGNSSSVLQVNDSSTLDPPSSLTVLTVFRPSTNSVSYVFGKGGSPAYGVESFDVGNYLAVAANISTTTGEFSDSATWTTVPGQSMLVAQVWDGTTETLYQGGQAQGIPLSATINYQGGGQPFYLGGGQSGSYSTSDLAEVLVYSRALSSAELQTSQSYLADKYGLYYPYASWPHTNNYSDQTQMLIANNHWSKQQADAYVQMASANPAFPADMVVWLKGGVATSEDSNGNVDSWRDQSLYHNDASSLYAGLDAGQGAIVVSGCLNGNAVLRFPGSSVAYLDIANNISIEPSSSVTVFGVLRNNPPQYGSPSWPIGKQMSSQMSYGLRSNSTPSSLAGGLLTSNNGQVITAGIASSSNQFLLGIENYNEASLELSQAEQTESSAATGLLPYSSGPNFRPLTIGGNGFNGDIAEVLVYNRSLSNLEQLDVACYLSTKYGIIGMPPPVLASGVISGSSTGSASVSFGAYPPGAQIRYTLNGTPPTPSSNLYTVPLVLVASAPITYEYFSGSQPLSNSATTEIVANDSNGDGLSDAWQMQYFGHLNVDPDALAPGGSGLTNLQCYLFEYNPTVYSTNGDGLSNVLNLQLGYAGNDTDINGYGLTNAQQLALGLDPFDMNVNPAPGSPPSPVSQSGPAITIDLPSNTTPVP